MILAYSHLLLLGKKHEPDELLALFVLDFWSSIKMRHGEKVQIARHCYEYRAESIWKMNPVPAAAKPAPAQCKPRGKVLSLGRKVMMRTDCDRRKLTARIYHQVVPVLHLAQATVSKPLFVRTSPSS